jgi:hypothetical protein
VAPSGSSGNHYQLLRKTSRVIATGSTAATATGTATATGSETATATATLGFYEETLIFQTSNFENLIQGIDALS